MSGSVACVASSTSASGKRSPDSGSPSERGERGAEHVRAVEHVSHRLALQRPRVVEQRAGLCLGRAGVGEALAAPPALPLPPGVPQQLERVVEQLPRQHAIRMLLHAHVERVLEQPWRDPRRVTDADGAQALGEAELQEVVHRGIARGGAEDAPVPGDRVGCHRGEHGALPGPRRAVDAEDVARGQRALHRQPLLRVERLHSLGGPLRLEARGLPAQQEGATSPGRPAVSGRHLGDRGVGAAERHVVGDEVQHQPAGADEVGRRPVERELDPVPPAARDQCPLRGSHLRAPGPRLDHVARAEGVAPRHPPGTGQRHQEAAAEAHVLVGEPRALPPTGRAPPALLA